VLVKIEGSLQCSQKPAILPYHTPDQSRSRSSLLSL